MPRSFDCQYTLFVNKCRSHLRRDDILGVSVEVLTCGVLIWPLPYELWVTDLEPTDQHQSPRQSFTGINILLQSAPTPRLRKLSLKVCELIVWRQPYSNQRHTKVHGYENLLFGYPLTNIHTENFQLEYVVRLHWMLPKTLQGTRRPVFMKQVGLPCSKQAAEKAQRKTDGGLPIPQPFLGMVVLPRAVSARRICGNPGIFPIPSLERL